MLFATSVSIPYRTMFAIPNAALMNIMACRVYRRIMLAGSMEKQNFSNFNPMAMTKNPITDNSMVTLTAADKTMV
jgi:hypothetical protein